MTKIGIIRCEKNDQRCPLTGCFNCLTETKEGFASYDECRISGIFTCKCPGDVTTQQAKILKAKGVEAIHFCTCTFAAKGENGWEMQNGGFCDHVEELIERVQKETGLPCVKGTAHLPKGYSV